MTEQERNKAALAELMGDARWAKSRLGKWIAIVGGEVIAESVFRSEVVSTIETNYPGKTFLIEQVL